MKPLIDFEFIKEYEATKKYKNKELSSYVYDFFHKYLAQHSYQYYNYYFENLESDPDKSNLIYQSTSSMGMEVEFRVRMNSLLVFIEDEYYSQRVHEDVGKGRAVTTARHIKGQRAQDLCKEYGWEEESDKAKAETLKRNLGDI